MSKAVSREPDLPEGWSQARLRDVTQHVPNVKPETEPERTFGYVDISSICNATNRIVDHKTFGPRSSVTGTSSDSSGRRIVFECPYVPTQRRDYRAGS